MISHVHEMIATQEPFSVVPSHPISPDEVERGRLARKVFEWLVDILKTASANATTPMKPLQRAVEKRP